MHPLAFVPLFGRSHKSRKAFRHDCLLARDRDRDPLIIMDRPIL